MAINLAQGVLGFVVVYTALALALPGASPGMAWVSVAIVSLAAIIWLAFKR